MGNTFAVNTDTLHASAQNLQQLTQNTLSSHNTQWQQIQTANANFPSEMYEANATCSANWQTYILNLYQYHQQLSGDMDKTATDFHALDNDVAASFADIISMDFPLF